MVDVATVSLSSFGFFVSSPFHNALICFAKLFQKPGFYHYSLDILEKRESALISIQSLGNYLILYITIRLLGQVCHFNLLICYPYLLIYFMNY